MKYTDINWNNCNKKVFKLQKKIIVAWEKKNFNLVTKLQETLITTFEARALAVRKVTSNKGKKTPGVDQNLLKTDIEKLEMINELKQLHNYKAIPVKTIMIPKANKKLRPLGIPSIKDRCVQALYFIALEPIAETTGEERSYGFRKYRSTQDVLQYTKTTLILQTCARYILDADIKGFFDNISHKWILDNIPMNKYILKEWLNCGYINNNSLHETKEGVPQGSIISPLIANMVLDGLGEIINKVANCIEKEVIKELKKNKQKSYYSSKIHYVRYADDFLITADKKEYFKRILEEVNKFLSIRGVKLNKEKTRIYSIEDGFDFVEFNLRKYKTTTRANGEIFLVTPAKKNIQKLKDNIKYIFKKYKHAITLIKALNPILRGWGLYYKYTNSSRLFSKLDHYIFNKTLKWIRTINRRRGMKEALKKYYSVIGNRKWNFQITEEGKTFRLFRLSSIKIKRYILIRNVNPFKDPTYFKKRLLISWYNSLSDIQIKLIKKQKGFCPVCKINLNLFDQEELEVHHIQPREFKGNQAIKNLLLLHKTCHQSVTNCKDPILLAKYVSEGIIKPLSKRYQKILDNLNKISGKKT